MLPRLRKIARKNETLRLILRRLYRWYQYNTARMVGKLRKNELSPLYVNPHSISHTISLEDQTLKTNSTWHFGAVIDGNWDLNGAAVSEYNHLYPILKERMIEGLSYFSIPEFQEHIQRIENGIFLDGCSTKEAYLQRWKQIEQLYESIRENGYLTQVELATDNPLDEIRIQIGRNGALLLEEGLHRLVIAQLLDLKQIPVIITRRHKNWEELRQAVIKILLLRGFIHQPFEHPDLAILPVLYGDQEKSGSMYGHERWEYITKSLPVNRGSVLDIGSYFGYFAHRFKDLGFEVYAVEPDPDNLAVLHPYKKIMGKSFTVLEQSIFDIEHHDFDIVLALNIFHHLIKTKRDYEKLVSFLQTIRCKAMYFEPASNDATAYKRFSDNEFVEWVLENSFLNHAKYLGITTERRNFYLLTP